MDTQEQLSVINGIGRPFAERVKEEKNALFVADRINTLQINVSRLCNLSCRHCHVQAGPDRKEIMPIDILKKCLETAALPEIEVIDITGGAPEMNPYLEWFISAAAKLKKRLMVRSNLVILADERYSRFMDVYQSGRVEIVTSLPAYEHEKSDKQRGKGTFGKTVEIIKELNKRGYGLEGTGLILDIVHNPVGAYMPAQQDVIEHEYRKKLKEGHGIFFSSLFTITNMPIGRYLDFLLSSGNFEDYMSELIKSFNKSAVDSAMCRFMVSIGWDGTIYDCDFNQMLGLRVDHGTPDNIRNFDIKKLNGRIITTANHCYGCTAGSGSSCQGATAENA